MPKRPTEVELRKFVNWIADFDDEECVRDPILYLSATVAWARKLTGKLNAKERAA